MSGWDWALFILGIAGIFAGTGIFVNQNRLIGVLITVAGVLTIMMMIEFSPNRPENQHRFEERSDASK